MAGFRALAGGLFLSAVFVFATSPMAVACTGPQPEADKKVLLTDVARAAKGIVAVGDGGSVRLEDPQTGEICAVHTQTKLFLTSVDFPTPDKGWIVGYGGVVLHSDDGGASWRTQVPPSDSTESQPLFSVRFVDEMRGVAVGAYGTMMITRDGGATWTRSGIKDKEGNAESRHIYALIRDGSGGLIAIGESGEPDENMNITVPGLLYRSTDGGETWLPLNSPYHGTLFGGLSLGGGRLLVFGLRGHLFSSDDEGLTWREINTGTTASFFGALQVAQDSALIFGSEGTMLRYHWGANTTERVVTGDGVIRDYSAGLYLTDRRRAIIVGNGGLQTFGAGQLGMAELSSKNP